MMTPARLMCAASGFDADMLYATGFYADDPFIWWEVRGKTHIALSPLEIDRARSVARVRKVHGNGEFLLPKAKGQGFDAIILGIAKQEKLRAFIVPSQFPAGLLEKLRRAGLKLTVSDQPFFPQRIHKTKEEVAALRAALRTA